MLMRGIKITPFSRARQPRRPGHRWIIIRINRARLRPHKREIRAGNRCFRRRLSSSLHHPPPPLSLSLSLSPRRIAKFHIRRDPPNRRALIKDVLCTRCSDNFKTKFAAFLESSRFPVNRVSRNAHAIPSTRYRRRCVNVAAVRVSPCRRTRLPR